MQEYHVPVLLYETISNLNLKTGDTVVDCTLGGGGHSLEILKNISPQGTLIAIDKDEEALKEARQKLSVYNENLILVNDDFKNLDNLLDNSGFSEVDAIVIDLGVSSHQLDEPERGFSYMHDADLDMRMDKSQKLTAREIVNTYSSEELTKIIRDFGEERWAKRIVNTIVNFRKQEEITSTFQLVDIIKKAIPAAARRKGPHPAKRTFQALRIEVNEELYDLDKVLEKGVKKLSQGGRIAVISFHSLEDRIVKKTFNHLAAECICPPGLPVCRCNHEPSLKIITKKPVIASEEEQQMNSRSRSAKLRVAQKI